MTKDILFLLIALMALITILASTIKEVIEILHEYYPSGAHPGRIRGASEVGPEADVCFYEHLNEYLNGLEGDDLDKALDVIIENGRFIDDLK